MFQIDKYTVTMRPAEVLSAGASSQAILNRLIVHSFGVENTFTSVDESYCAEFREKARVLLMGVVEE